MRRRVQTSHWRPTTIAVHQPQTSQQRRCLHFENGQAKQLLREYGVQITDTMPGSDYKNTYVLAVTADRSTRQPAVIVSPTGDPAQSFHEMISFPYSYTSGPSSETLNAALSRVQSSESLQTDKVTTSITELIKTLTTLFKEKEAYSIETHLTLNTETSVPEVYYAKLSFDDSALKSGNRQTDIHSQRDTASLDADELSVEKDGIVYIKLDNDDAYVATLINGAGLAMNALDVLHDKGAYPTNFLDTGGKATSETIKKSFEVILKDARVKVVFVNIFGGLTRCDMVAEGIILAFKELDMKTPVVVRLRGTNEEAGQKLIAESGLPPVSYTHLTLPTKRIV